ncbi:MAG: hypothetical protein ACJA0H_000313 [Francisellaceae bacterium]|jgi:hypothetical protein
MSGYSSITGIFELTWSKASKYLAHRNKQIEDEEQYLLELITNSGYTYLGQTAYGYNLVANNAQIWKLLSGEEATFGETDESPEDIYQAWKLNREWFNATELGKEFNPKLSAIKINRSIESLGHIIKTDGGWVPSKNAEKCGLVRKRDSAQAYGNKPCVELNIALLSFINDLKK